ncbi:serine hydrolase domain-containing protein [Knoellia sp. S7-12]|uniref:serine hydrolase domain-containing protein n=1 Tax=Knoellia sp. S7-12 TaxID=3126698 RepID=UPI003366DC82
METFGDAALAERLAATWATTGRIGAMATLTPDGVAVASHGAPLTADYEIGSISKGVTGLLFCDAVDRGEVTADATVADFLPLGGTAVGRVSLASLSTHTSGLPSLPPAAHPVKRTVRLWRHGTNPYGESLAELCDQVRGLTPGKAKFAYSNLGFQLLGHCVAAASGHSYADLVRLRVAEPLRLGSFRVVTVVTELGAESLLGVNRFGKEQEAWTGEALAPAGGIRASIESMATFTEALRTGAAPGLRALEPSTQVRRGLRIGAGWITLQKGTHAITWHNGGTGGFRSWLGVDRERGVGAVVLGATSRSVDRLGFDLLASLGRDAG